MIGRRRKPFCEIPADPNPPLFIGRRTIRFAESADSRFELAKKCDCGFVCVFIGGSCQVLFPAAKRVLAFAPAEFVAFVPAPVPPAFVGAPLPWNGFHQCPLFADVPEAVPLEVA